MQKISTFLRAPLIMICSSRSHAALVFMAGALLGVSVWAQPVPPAPPAPAAPSALPGGGYDADPRPGRPDRPAPPVARPAIPAALPPGAFTAAPPPRPVPPRPPLWRPPPPAPAVTFVPSWRAWPYYDPFGYPWGPYRALPYPSYPSYVLPPMYGAPAPFYGATVVVPPAAWGVSPPVQWVERPVQSAISSGQPGAPLPGYWYWCANPPGWFPQVQDCAEGFEPVTPQPEGTAP